MLTENVLLFFKMVRRLSLALSLLTGTILVGVVGFMVLEDYTLVDAFYMTMITVSTVGFTEVKALSPTGRIFTSVLIVLNIGIFTYSITTITRFVVEGGIRQFIQHHNVEQKIQNLRDHVIVCGFGRNGKQACAELVLEDVPFVVIENNDRIIEHLRKQYHYLFIEGDSTEEDTLMQARIHEARALITTLPRDSDNVFVILTARELKHSLVIVSRATSESSEIKIKKAGADHVIMPERIGGSRMASMVTKPDAVEFLQIISAPGTAGIVFEEFTCNQLRQDVANKTIGELDIRNRTGVNIIGIKLANGQYIINPAPDHPVQPDTKLIVLGNQSQIQQFQELIH